MKVCATTERQESTMLDLPRSNTKFGFLIRFTQNLRIKFGINVVNMRQQKAKITTPTKKKELGCLF
jgi:hypothetical protein